MKRFLLNKFVCSSLYGNTGKVVFSHSALMANSRLALAKIVLYLVIKGRSESKTCAKFIFSLVDFIL